MKNTNKSVQISLRYSEHLFTQFIKLLALNSTHTYIYICHQFLNLNHRIRTEFSADVLTLVLLKSLFLLNNFQNEHYIRVIKQT